MELNRTWWCASLGRVGGVVCDVALGRLVVDHVLLLLLVVVEVDRGLGIEKVAGARVVIQARRCVKHVLGL